MTEHVKSVIEAMRGNPACLAAVLIVGLFVGLQYIRTERNATIQERRIAELSNLLIRCVDNEVGQ